MEPCRVEQSTGFTSLSSWALNLNYLTIKLSRLSLHNFNSYTCEETMRPLLFRSKNNIHNSLSKSLSSSSKVPFFLWEKNDFFDLLEKNDLSIYKPNFDSISGAMMMLPEFSFETDLNITDRKTILKIKSLVQNEIDEDKRRFEKESEIKNYGRTNKFCRIKTSYAKKKS